MACTEPQCLYKGALYLYLTVKLYLYSPYWSYGLYRASVPVKGCTSPLLLHVSDINGHQYSILKYRKMQYTCIHSVGSHRCTLTVTI